jgi:cytochrome c oxidase cbb3-type subunit I
LTCREWPSANLIYIHFWGTALGITLYVVPMSFGGILQGIAMNNPDIPFLDVVKLTLPYLKLRTWSGVLLGIGHIAFFINFGWILLRQLGPYRDPAAIIVAGTKPQTLVAQP